MAEQTESSITVDAPPAAVLAVIADLAAYPEWNDEMTQAEVLAARADGRPTTARFVLDSGAVKDEYTLAYTWPEGSPEGSPEGRDSAEVRWHLVGEGRVLTRMDGSYQLSGSAAGPTEVTYRLAVDVRVPMIGLIKRKAEKVIVDRALRGLKRRVEA